MAKVKYLWEGTTVQAIDRHSPKVVVMAIRGSIISKGVRCTNGCDVISMEKEDLGSACNVSLVQSKAEKMGSCLR